ncbi:retrotransposon nucleocapsid related protein [Cyclospora cayetanensis]|uniref:Retrotransposon nucleocapsid related protein n=1 Tax=Cyclospora cayetanensis TaxID=88456 RepID=A0A1D3D370_9EIME|nr:retrotransposon nucleocapsid related protein [Cyclospora cayetanensis]
MICLLIEHTVNTAKHPVADLQTEGTGRTLLQHLRLYAYKNSDCFALLSLDLSVLQASLFALVYPLVARIPGLQWEATLQSRPEPGVSESASTPGTGGIDAQLAGTCECMRSAQEKQA